MKRIFTDSPSATIDEREIGDAVISGEFPLRPPTTRAISQWACSLDWRQAVTQHILVEKICISFFLFYCEGVLSLVVLWLCVCHERSFAMQFYRKKNSESWIRPYSDIFSYCDSFKNWIGIIVGRRQHNPYHWTIQWCRKVEQSGWLIAGWPTVSSLLSQI